MSKPKDYYWENVVRSLTDIRNCAAKNIYSCEHQPLLNIPLENVVLDELHLMLRITGWYIHNVQLYHLSPLSRNVS